MWLLAWPAAAFFLWAAKTAGREELLTSAVPRSLTDRAVRAHRAAFAAFAAALVAAPAKAAPASYQELKQERAPRQSAFQGPDLAASVNGIDCLSVLS